MSVKVRMHIVHSHNTVHAGVLVVFNLYPANARKLAYIFNALKSQLPEIGSMYL